jgi:hypothetical protein
MSNVHGMRVYAYYRVRNKKPIDAGDGTMNKTKPTFLFPKRYWAHAW